MYGPISALCLEKSSKVSEGVLEEMPDTKPNSKIQCRSIILNSNGIISPDNKLKTTYELRLGRDLRGNKTVNEYRLIRNLGKGAYAKVKLAVHSITQKQYAIKIVHRSFLLKSTQPVINTLTGK